MSNINRTPYRKYYATVTEITTGVFAGAHYCTNKAGTKHHLFIKAATGKRNHPVFAITDAAFNVLRWTGPKAAEAEAHYTV